MINGQNIGRGGGAIFNAGTLSVDACVFSNNLAPTNIGGGAISRPVRSPSPAAPSTATPVAPPAMAAAARFCSPGTTTSTAMSVSSSTFTNNSG
jgi:predicted outer membrane repeat protein